MKKSLSTGRDLEQGQAHVGDPLADGWSGKGEAERRKGRGKVKKRRRRTDQTLVFCPEYIDNFYACVLCEASLQVLQSKTVND